jgi:hypothetical protein
VAQVKVPMRLIRDGFNVASSVLPPGGTTAVLVRAVTVVLHAAGVRQPGTLIADIRGRIGADGYLAPSAYGACDCGMAWREHATAPAEPPLTPHRCHPVSLTP